MTLTEVSIHSSIRPVFVCLRGEDETTVSLCNTGNYKLYCNYQKITKKNTQKFIFDSYMTITIWRNVYRFIKWIDKWKNASLLNKIRRSNTKHTVPRNNQNLYQRKKVSWEIIFGPIFFIKIYIFCKPKHQFSMN